MQKKRIAAAIAGASALALVQAAPAARAADGAQIFHKDCFVCHDTEPGKNKIGPSLAGVVGRKAGTAADFTYSTAMQSSGLTWDAKTLDRYLTNPRGVVPGTKMLFVGIKDTADRQAIIEYLTSLKD